MQKLPPFPFLCLFKNPDNYYLFYIQKSTFVQNMLLFAILNKHKLANYIFLKKNK